MYEFAKDFVLKILKVPPEPEDPMGNVKSLKVFRASYNYFRYKYYFWLIRNIVGLIISLAVAGLICSGIYVGTYKSLGNVPALFITLLIGLTILFFYLLQMYFSYVLLRLDYEMRWYKITDRSLRIREGIFQVKEMTMSFANIQNISVEQGPLQRIFKIADLKVESAGGGSVMVDQAGAASAGMHMAFFKGVDNAEEISQLMRERLRRLKDAGLGDQDDPEDADTEENLGDGSMESVLEVLRDESHAFRLAVERLAYGQ